MKWAAFIGGLALIISPWVLGFSAISLAKWCNVLAGLALAIVGAWGLFGESSVFAVPEPIEAREQSPSKRRTGVNGQNQHTTSKNYK